MLKELISPTIFAGITIWGNSVIVGRRFEDMRREIGSRFDSLDRKIDSLDRRLDEMHRRMHRRLNDMDRRLDTLEKELDGMDKKMIGIVGKFDLLTFRQHELGVHYMAMAEKWLTDCSKRRG